MPTAGSPGAPFIYLVRSASPCGFDARPHFALRWPRSLANPSAPSDYGVSARTARPSPGGLRRQPCRDLCPPSPRNGNCVEPSSPAATGRRRALGATHGHTRSTSSRSEAEGGILPNAPGTDPRVRQPPMVGHREGDAHHRPRCHERRGTALGSPRFSGPLRLIALFSRKTVEPALRWCRSRRRSSWERPSCQGVLRGASTHQRRATYAHRPSASTQRGT